jgi:tetratricopeptide (TPR) repeat protein
MDAVTYPDEKVVDFIGKNVVPLKLSFDAKPMADDYNVKWTPTLITVNGGGKEHHRTVGFLPPEELIPSLMLGIGKVHFDAERIGEALKYFENIVKEFPRSDSTAEALYFKGVSEYKNTHDAKPLKMAYERLQAEYPTSMWTKRAYPYRLL